MYEQQNGEGELFIPADKTIFDHLDSVLDDKDTFLIKLPHKFKEYLTDPETKSVGYTMTSESQTIGKVESALKPTGMPVKSNPEIQIEQLLGAGETKHGSSGLQSNVQKIELMMQLNFPGKRDRMSREQVMFELGLPSLNDIRASKRRRVTTQPDREHELSFVCTLEGKGGNDDQRGIPLGKKQARCQGYLDHPVIGEASLRPSSIADLDSKAKREMKESEIKELLTSADDKRSKI